jgi:hypothetical protein
MVKHKLAIDYNTNQPMGVVSLDPYNFLVYDKLFDNFQIVTPHQQTWLKHLPLGSDPVSLNLKKDGPDKLSRYVSSKKFVERFKSDSRRKYVLYSPLDPPYKINPLAFLMNSPTIAHAYENQTLKRIFK